MSYICMFIYNKTDIQIVPYEEIISSTVLFYLPIICLMFCTDD